MEVIKPKFRPGIDLDEVTRKRRKMCDLPLDEKIEIVHKVLIQHLSYPDICQLHQVKRYLVRSLVKKTLANDKFFEELRHMEMKKEKDRSSD